MLDRVQITNNHLQRRWASSNSHVQKYIEEVNANSKRKLKNGYKSEAKRKEYEKKKRVLCFQFITQHREILQNDEYSDKLLTKFDEDNDGIAHGESNNENLGDVDDAESQDEGASTEEDETFDLVFDDDDDHSTSPSSDEMDIGDWI